MKRKYISNMPIEGFRFSIYHYRNDKRGYYDNIIN